MTPLRVLYLTPPAKGGAAIAAQSGVALVGMKTGDIAAMAGPSRLAIRHPGLTVLWPKPAAWHHASVSKAT